MMQYFPWILGAVVVVLGAISGRLAFKSWKIPNGEIEDFREITAKPENPAPVPTSQHIQAPVPIVETSPPEAVYELAYSLRGMHLSLNSSVGPEVGCAEAVSFVLKNCGYPIPQGGIATVSGLVAWMLEHSFTPIPGYRTGCVITGRNGADAHIGICGKSWILSNTSYTDASKKLVAGLWQANYVLSNWQKAYPQVRFFMPPKAPQAV